MSHSRLSTPAQKLFACQLLCCSSDHDSSSRQDVQVWLQGIVVLVSDDGNNVLLDDGTAVVHATGVTKIVKNAAFCKGMYIMIAGQLTALGTGMETYPTIKVLKIADLSENLTCETLWLLEVLDAQLNQSTAVKPHISG